jgi:hypothetical protein
MGSIIRPVHIVTGGLGCGWVMGRGCHPEDLDVQPEIFEKYWAEKDVGRISVTWEWMEGQPTGVL